jgi:two-component system, chemotaxis family, sensor kinase CheA
LGLDMAKYRALFLEEATEHLSEISAALLALEKDPRSVESIDVIFRMAHSIKSMAASLDYTSVTDLAHALEDRMEHVRSRGGVADGAETASLFQGLEGLEAMVRAVREAGEAPPPQPELVEALRCPVQPSEPETPTPETPTRLKKKLLR